LVFLASIYIHELAAVGQMIAVFIDETEGRSSSLFYLSTTGDVKHKKNKEVSRRRNTTNKNLLSKIEICE